MTEERQEVETAGGRAAGVVLLRVGLCRLCADCERHRESDAEGDCKGDCADLGGGLQQNRVLLGVATARRLGREVNGVVNALPQFRYVRRKSTRRRGRYR